MSEPRLLLAILAAGGSRRLGRPKQLVSIDGVPLVRRQCSVALSANLGPVAVIVGSHGDDVAAAVADLPIAICWNREWQEGLAASLRRAVTAARADRAAALLVLACDQYRITGNDLRHLHDVWRGGRGVACVSRAGEHVGPPAVLPLECYDQLLSLRGDIGARPVLFDPRRTPPLEIENPRANVDLDCPRDLDDAHGCVAVNTDRRLTPISLASQGRRDGVGVAMEAREVSCRHRLPSR
jgi:CTP:molybdopterin cytidylyltransferase MocA